MDTEHLVYLYCVTAQPPELASMGEPPGQLYLVSAAGLCAIVSRVEASQFEPSHLRQNLENLEWLAAETTRHERIVEAVMRKRCVIPFRFGTLFHSDESLQAQLGANGKPLRTLLEDLAGKTEWGVKAYGDVPRLEESIRSQGGPLSDLEEMIRQAAPGRAFFLRKKREDLVKAAVAGRIDQYAGRMVEALQTVSIQMRMNKILPVPTVDRRGAMIFNAAFLVADQDVQTFRNTVHTLSERCADPSIAVECTGPWPPYNFCESSSLGVPPISSTTVPAVNVTKPCADARPKQQVANG